MDMDDELVWSEINRLQSELHDIMESDNDDKLKHVEAICAEISVLLNKVT